MKYKILAIIGESGSGKDSILKLFDDNPHSQINRIVSSTTRPPREGEIDGVNYHFLDHDDFISLMEEEKIVEMSVFKDWCYGTCFEDLRSGDIINIGVFDPTRVETLANSLYIDLKIVLIEATDKERLLRQLTRENNPDVEEIIRRFKTDKEDFKYIKTLYDVIKIPNHDGDLNKAYQKILNIVNNWDKVD